MLVLIECSVQDIYPLCPVKWMKRLPGNIYKYYASRGSIIGITSIMIYLWYGNANFAGWKRKNLWLKVTWGMEKINIWQLKKYFILFKIFEFLRLHSWLSKTTLVLMYFVLYSKVGLPTICSWPIYMHFMWSKGANDGVLLHRWCNQLKE